MQLRFPLAPACPRIIAQDSFHLLLVSFGLRTGIHRTFILRGFIAKEKGGAWFITFQCGPFGVGLDCAVSGLNRSCELADHASLSQRIGFVGARRSVFQKIYDFAL